jgi:hypothetical protein
MLLALNKTTQPGGGQQHQREPNGGDAGRVDQRMEERDRVGSCRVPDSYLAVFLGKLTPVISNVRFPLGV